MLDRIPLRALPLLAALAAAPAGFAEAQEAPSVAITGSARLRYEVFERPFPAGRTHTDWLLNARTLVRADLGLGAFTLTGELLDSRRLASATAGRAWQETDALEPIQALAAWRGKGVLEAGDQLDVQLGRMTLDIGSRRLVARPNFRSVFTAFDGVRADWTGPQGLRLTAFHVAPNRRLPETPAAALDNEPRINSALSGARLSGLHASLPVADGTSLESYVFALDETDRPGEASRNRQLTTWGARARAPARKGGIDFDVEATRQSGSLRASSSASDLTDLDHSAHMVHLEAGFTIPAAREPRLALHLDHASGDRSAADGRSERFDTLFGDRSFEFGPTSLFGVIARANLLSVGARLEWKPDEASDALVMVRDMRLDEKRDAFGQSGLRDPSGLAGSVAGTQIEARYRRRFQDGRLQMETGAAVVLPGRFLQETAGAGASETSVYSYWALTRTF